MSGPFWRGVLAGLVSFLVLIAAAAVILDAATSTVPPRNRGFVIASCFAGLIAGYVGARFAQRVTRRMRYLAGILGPAAIALVFAITSNAEDQSARWLALVLTIAGAVAGVMVRERLRVARR